MRRSAWISIFGAVAAQTVVVSTAEAGINDAVLIGVVRDARTREAVEGAVVVVTGDKLQGERTMTTNVSGLYRIPNLPPGVYEVTVLHPNFGDGQKRKGLQLRAGTTIRVDFNMIPSGDREVINVEVPAPTIDIGSAATGLGVDKEMARRVPIVTPTAKGGANRSFEALAEATPGGRADTYGTSVAGTTSPENKYYIDGLSTNDPGFGLNGTGLSSEFVEEVRVEAGGYMPEHGRSTGGIINAVTKTGSNEFHGGVWAFYTPGQLEGRRAVPLREGAAIQAERPLSWQGDAGFDVGGRLIKDKLWFYGGVSVARQVYNIDTAWYRQVVRDEDSGPVDPETMLPKYLRGEYLTDEATGFARRERIPGTGFRRKAQGTAVQILGKLTYTPHKQHTLELLGIYAPQLSGGNGTYGIDQRTGAPVAGVLGNYNALANRYRDTSGDLQLKHSFVTADGKWNIDTIVGWHHQRNQLQAADGSGIGSGGVLATTPGVIYRQNNPGFHDITEFADLPAGAPGRACDPFLYDPMLGASDPLNRVSTCPVTTWTTGGPGFLYDRKLDRGQARLMVTRLARAAGHHVIKFGMDFEYMNYNSNRGYTGGVLYRENAAGTTFSDYRQYAFLTGPDQFVRLNSLNWNVYSTTIGGYVQDSWSIMDKVTLNAGVRYDAQHLWGGDKQLAMALPNQISPRAGLIWDPTQNGHAKLFVNYARFFQSVPLNLADRAGSGEPQLVSVHDKMGCDPTNIDSHNGGCQSDEFRRILGDSSSPNQRYVWTGGGKTPLDPNLKPQRSDEIVAGAEYEIFTNGRLGAAYTHRWLGRVIEDMSRDEAATYFIGNPGYGIAKDFPKAQRIYDSLNVYLEKRWAKNWLLTGSYTLSFLRGNISGLFRPENGQLDPNINSDFDLASLLGNRYGYLPGDTRHSIKIFTAGEIVLGGGNSLLLGGAFRANSGGPTDALGSHSLYGPNEAFIIPRGTGPRMPWNFRIDGNIGYRRQLTKDLAIAITMDVFNVANFQQTVLNDQSYTLSDVRPLSQKLSVAELDREVEMGRVLDVTGVPIVKNPNFGRPLVFQTPRQFRFGIRLTF
jgi:outer membrane receptor protein involved in Fe transport